MKCTKTVVKYSTEWVLTLISYSYKYKYLSAWSICMNKENLMYLHNDITVT